MASGQRHWKLTVELPRGRFPELAESELRGQEDLVTLLRQPFLLTAPPG